MEELRVLDRRIVSLGKLEEATPIAMRDALGLAKPREATRQTCLAAFDAVWRAWGYTATLGL
jgi:hypothetical protein